MCVVIKSMYLDRFFWRCLSSAVRRKERVEPSRESSNRSRCFFAREREVKLGLKLERIDGGGVGVDILRVTVKLRQLPRIEAPRANPTAKLFNSSFQSSSSKIGPQRGL
jgi:hypothetical protein